MNRVTLENIKRAIKNLSGNDFQNFVSYFYLIVYGNDFQVIKQKRDKGCDGIINDEIILSVYAPDEYKTRAFETKFKSDFDKYKNEFLERYPKWQVVFNRELTAGNIQFLKNLKSDVIVEDISTIMQKIEYKCNWTQTRNIFDHLGIEKCFWYNNIFIQVIDDLIKKSEIIDQTDTTLKRKIPIYIEDKIKLNYNENDVEMAKRQYCSFLENGDFDRLLSVLSSLEERTEILKKKIIGDFINTNEKMTFKEKLNTLINKYSQDYENDDEYRQAVSVVLIYYFEYCLIGRKTEGE